MLDTSVNQAAMPNNLFFVKVSRLFLQLPLKVMWCTQVLMEPASILILQESRHKDYWRWPATCNAQRKPDSEGAHWCPTGHELPKSCSYRQGCFCSSTSCLSKATYQHFNWRNGGQDQFTPSGSDQGYRYVKALTLYCSQGPEFLNKQSRYYMVIGYMVINCKAWGLSLGSPGKWHDAPYYLS